MSFADTCLVRMSETLTDPVILTTIGTSASIAATAARPCETTVRAACLHLLSRDGR